MRGRTVCIVVAAGSGSRFGSQLPKQFCLLGGRPVLMTTIERLRKSLPDQAEIVLVLSADYTGYWADLCRGHGFVSPEVVVGGATRWHSVKNALDAVGPAEYVYVHDGARPLVCADVLERLERALQLGVDGAIPVVKLPDSLRMVTPDGSASVDRSVYRAVQTPQAFDGKKLAEAYRQEYLPVFTDDASVMEAAGYRNLELVEGSANTVKITAPEDLMIVEALSRGC